MFRSSLCALVAIAAAPTAVVGEAAAATSTGGAAAPEVKRVRCADGTRWSCGRGERLTIAGTQLEHATRVVFVGRRGRSDDRSARPTATTAGGVTVRVPPDARSGPLKVRADGTYATTERPLEVTRDAPPEAADGAAAKIFAGSRRPASFGYRVTGPVPPDATIDVVRIRDGRVVTRRAIEAAPGSSATATFSGLVRGVPVEVGLYAFRPSSGADGVIEPEAGATEPFTVYDHIFPIRGRHDLGQSATNNFGGGRGHQGQDMFAACGTPLAAVTAGRVTTAGYHSASGNYFVLKRADGQSYAYMHMRDPALVSEGDRVYAGQRVGFVGDTGRATGCHLHFELWTAPGWWEGGEAVDPLPALKRWDRWS